MVTVEKVELTGLLAGEKAIEVRITGEYMDERIGFLQGDKLKEMKLSHIEFHLRNKISEIKIKQDTKKNCLASIGLLHFGVKWMNIG